MALENLMAILTKFFPLESTNFDYINILEIYLTKNILGITQFNLENQK